MLQDIKLKDKLHPGHFLYISRELLIVQETETRIGKTLKSVTYISCMHIPWLAAQVWQVYVNEIYLTNVAQHAPIIPPTNQLHNTGIALPSASPPSSIQVHQK